MTKIIGFVSNKLTLRGTEVCLYDYADCNETILGNKKIIITRPYSYVQQYSPKDVHPEAYSKFRNRFPIEYYTNPNEITDIVKRNNIDILFIEKAGNNNDDLVFSCCKTIIHSVFTTKFPHGTLYSGISDFLNKKMNTKVPVLPYMVRVHDTQENLRKELNIPADAIVFGSYSGQDNYDIGYVKQAVCNVVTNPDYKHIYFIYLNIDKFGPTCENLHFLPGTSDMKYKRMFINTCDAMLYGRTGGETFGLACGEFSICGKPIIARPGEHSCAHEDILGDAMIKCSNYEDLVAILTNWNTYKKDVSNNGYFNYRPQKVMENFQTHIQKICDEQFFLIKYGKNEKTVDITAICSLQLAKQSVIRIPSGDGARAKLFTDPCYGILKSIYISVGNIVKEYDHTKTIYVDTKANQIFVDEIPEYTQKIYPNVDEKLQKIQNSLILHHGSFKEELPEQKMVVQYFTGKEKVLEIGSNIGRNSLVIASILREYTNNDFVTLESDTNIAGQLRENRDKNNFQFHIENSALSKRSLIQQGWVTKENRDRYIPDGWKNVQTITLEELRKKYNIQFDTLVLDCEGALYYILMDMPEILDGISLIIMENDYHEIAHKNYIDEILIKHNFYVDYSESGGWGPCYPNFFEVWKR